MRRLARFAGTGLVVLVGATAALWWWRDSVPRHLPPRSASPTAVPLAVLGDSNSHSYQDRIAFPEGSDARGGIFRPRTFNWTEVLARLRPEEVDSGAWTVSGSSGLIASSLDALGLPVGRAPRKEDYLYNFANSGATCKDLVSGRFRQAPRLVALMDREPERWKRGVVVVRIGLNDWSPLLDLQAETPGAPELAAVTQGCLDAVQTALALIRASHPETRILLVGIANEADGAPLRDRWVHGRERRNIREALTRFNGALRSLAESRADTAFFDDDAWFMQQWGSRGGAPAPAFKTVTVGRSFIVTNSNGDEPHHALLADDHAGLVFNALWAQSLVMRLREAFRMPITPITDEEVAAFVLPLAEGLP